MLVVLTNETARVKHDEALRPLWSGLIRRLFEHRLAEDIRFGLEKSPNFITIE